MTFMPVRCSMSLVGDRLMRVVYLDETGHSFKEPHAAVAGVLLDPDQQWAALAQSIDHLKKDVPEQFRNGFFFHASDLFGGGKWRSTWPDEDRCTC